MQPNQAFYWIEDAYHDLATIQIEELASSFEENGFMEAILDASE